MLYLINVFNTLLQCCYELTFWYEERQDKLLSPKGTDISNLRVLTIHVIWSFIHHVIGKELLEFRQHDNPWGKYLAIISDILTPLSKGKNAMLFVLYYALVRQCKHKYKSNVHIHTWKKKKRKRYICPNTWENTLGYIFLYIRKVDFCFCSYIDANMKIACIILYRWYTRSTCCMYHMN